MPSVTGRQWVGDRMPLYTGWHGRGGHGACRLRRFGGFNIGLCTKRQRVSDAVKVMYAARDNRNAARPRAQIKGVVERGKHRMGERQRHVQPSEAEKGGEGGGGTKRRQRPGIFGSKIQTSAGTAISTRHDNKTTHIVHPQCWGLRRQHGVVTA